MGYPSCDYQHSEMKKVAFTSTSSCTPSMLPSVHGSMSVDWEWGNGARIVAKSRTHSFPSLRARHRICCISTEHQREGREGGRGGGREGREEGREGREGRREGGRKGERERGRGGGREGGREEGREPQEGREGERKGGREGGKGGEEWNRSRESTIMWTVQVKMEHYFIILKILRLFMY